MSSDTENPGTVILHVPKLPTSLFDYWPRAKEEARIVLLEKVEGVQRAEDEVRKCDALVEQLSFDPCSPSAHIRICILRIMPCAFRRLEQLGAWEVSKPSHCKNSEAESCCCQLIRMPR